tara:strand:+ start:1645 stop:2046 length:402 start_codon:yes stop_codon:yes gene_type:complete
MACKNDKCENCKCNESPNKISKLKDYKEFINESMVFLTLKKTMTNEFMNNIELKQDFENSRRLLYDNGGFILSHMGGELFELRTYSNVSEEELIEILDSRINPSTKRMKFSKKGNSKKSNIKENVWTLKAVLY